MPRPHRRIGLTRRCRSQDRVGPFRYACDPAVGDRWSGGFVSGRSRRLRLRARRVRHSRRVGIGHHSRRRYRSGCLRRRLAAHGDNQSCGIANASVVVRCLVLMSPPRDQTERRRDSDWTAKIRYLHRIHEGASRRTRSAGLALDRWPPAIAIVAIGVRVDFSSTMPRNGAHISGWPVRLWKRRVRLHATRTGVARAVHDGAEVVVPTEARHDVVELAPASEPLVALRTDTRSHPSLRAPLRRTSLDGLQQQTRSRSASTPCETSCCGTDRRSCSAPPGSSC